MQNISFETERLFVEPMKNEDSDFIYQLVNSEGWIKNIGDRNINNIEDAAHYIHKIVNNSNYTYLVFKLKETQKSLGLVTLIKRDYLEDYDIGFAILPEFEKKGYAYEASQKFMEIIKTNKICNKVLAITLPENISSILLIEKLGLEYINEITEKNEKLAVYQKII